MASTRGQCRLLPSPAASRPTPPPCGSGGVFVRVAPSWPGKPCKLVVWSRGPPALWASVALSERPLATPTRLKSGPQCRPAGCSRFGLVLLACRSEACSASFPVRKTSMLPTGNNVKKKVTTEKHLLYTCAREQKSPSREGQGGRGTMAARKTIKSFQRLEQFLLVFFYLSLVHRRVWHGV